MDRKTLLAVVISVVIIVGGMVLTPLLFPTKQTAPQAAPQGSAQAAAPAADGTQAPQPAASTAQAAQPAPVTNAATVAMPGKVVPLPDSAPAASAARTITRETDLYRLTFLQNGGTLSSVQLKKYKNVDGSLVDMILPPKIPGQDDVPFAISFGDYKAEPLTVPFNLAESSDNKGAKFDFYRTFLSPTGVPFTLHKTYFFDKDEYLFELQIAVQNSVNDFPALDFGGYAYTLTLGPQIGPHYAKLDNRNDYRNYAFYAENKRQDPKVGMGQLKDVDKNVTWAAIVGKYFTAIAKPDGSITHVVYDSRKLIEGFDRSAISFERPVLKSATNKDTYRFYMGPMLKDKLAVYNEASKNAFGETGLHADEVVTSSILIGWLATLLKYLLDFFYLLIPNYGIAIILVTLFTKLIFLPLTFKSSESTAKMAALNPKMAEIRARLKDKPDKMNQEIAALYKKEKVNPLSGCLPLLLQLPVFFALYNLLNSHFELRGALFIPGWISDLSAPESILNFGFTVPMVNWTALRGLPILMVASQLISTKFTQPPSATPQQGGAQMKLFTYALPIVFLFILYDMPSGLVLYWTIQNILSAFQQIYINWLRKKKDLEAQASQPTVVVRSSKSGVRTGGRQGK